ncbi:MAG: RtcB family protein [Nanoarchaeota archaeon]|nr:RtcB family protein [Nanoarchaeota archaeon]
MKMISENVWEIPREGKMRVPARIFASDILMEKIKADKSLLQVKNVAALPGIQKFSLAMPDAHQGYGFSIGGVAAFDMDEGIISPGGVGYDINCSVRLLRTDMMEDDISSKRKQLLEELSKEVPAGVGRSSKMRLSREELDEVLSTGAKWAVKKGYGTVKDLKHIEEGGSMQGRPDKVSDLAKKRGMPQIGTLGAGNHFLEMQKVDKIFMPEVAERFGITKPGQVMVMIHCGSRGLGHQVASDYIRAMENKFGISHLPDRELINAPISSELGQDYYHAMSAAANFGFANKQMITHWVRQCFDKVFGSNENMDTVYEVCHNIAKMEQHMIDGEKKKLCVHRKGATRSFGPGKEEVPEDYRDLGQPVIIPGSMGTASYLLVGTKKAEEISFGSTAHGAGRVASRSEALRTVRGEQVKKELKQKGIEVWGHSSKGLAEEAPQFYKDVDEVVRVSDALGIGKMVARVVPLAVLKG